MVTFDGLKFSGVNRANPNDSPGPTHEPGPASNLTGQSSKSIVHPQYEPEVDDYLKLGDIKGEVSSSRESVGGSSHYSPWDHDTLNDSHFAPAKREVGWWTVDGADFRGIQQDVRTNSNDNRLGYSGSGSEQVSLDVGPVNQTADIWANGGDSAHKAEALTNGGPEGYTEVEWTYLANGGSNADALLQQPRDVAGLISPDQMQPAEFFSHNPEWFAPGSAVNALGASNPMGIEPDQMVGVISRGDMFAAANELRSDNRF